MNTNWQGRWALVTGASSGIGRAFAKELAVRGANVVLHSRSRDKLEELAQELDGTRVRVIASDIASEEGLATLVEQTRDLTIDHIVVNAGLGRWGAFAEQDSSSQREMVRLNCEAAIATVHAFLPGMVERKSGGVMLVASTAAFQPMPNFAVYAASKAFLRSFGEALAEEVRSRGVFVQVLCPGPVPTGFQARAKTVITKAQRSAVLSAEQVATSGLDAFEQRRRLHIPGRRNRVTSSLARILPNSVIIPAVRRMFLEREGH